MVEVQLAGLRRNLERDSKRPDLILTVSGIGYKLSGRVELGAGPLFPGDTGTPRLRPHGHSAELVYPSSR